MGQIMLLLKLFFLPFAFLYWLFNWWRCASTFAERNRIARLARRLKKHLSHTELQKLNCAAVASGKRHGLSTKDFTELYDCACDLLDRQCFELDDVIKLIDRRAEFCAKLKKAA